jgi:serine/threonine protein kinase
LPRDTVVSYVQQLASALQYAHDQRLIPTRVPDGIIRRNMK